MKRIILTTFVTVQSILMVYGQGRSPVLFYYGGHPVNQEEFMHMYTKNLNNKKADLSEPALREYLRLYSLFKMKVQEANDMQMDTIPSVRNEIETYRKQLAKTYLADNEVIDNLVSEAYFRMQKDVRVAHIMLQNPRNVLDTGIVHQKIDSIYQAIVQKKASFEDMARIYSDDKQSALNGGDIGFISALQVVYPFENVAYETKKGDISKPFKTVYGFHILKKIDERPARGDIQVAQIMVYVKKSDGDSGRIAQRAKIEEALAALKKGVPFAEVEKKYNEDEFSKGAGGVLQPFGVGQMALNFEDAAFALKKPGDFSDIIETEYGFHIVSLVQKIPLKPLEEIKGSIKNRVEKDSRVQIARQQYVEDVKRKLGYKEYPFVLNEAIQAIPDTAFTNGNFKAMNYRHLNKPLFTFEDHSFTQMDFMNYVQLVTKGRIYGSKELTLRNLFSSYAEKAVMDYEESQLEYSNPEYKSLLQEYRDGILIFELTDQKVWSRAPKDSAGLENYYHAHSSNYTWGPCVEGKLYRSGSEDQIKELLRELNKENPGTTEEIIERLNQINSKYKLSAEVGKFEKTKFDFKVPYQEGKYMPYFSNPDGTYSLLFVDKVYDGPTTKTFHEARGYVIADYQEYLEKEWHQSLLDKYPVKVEEKVFRSMIK